MPGRAPDRRAVAAGALPREPPRDGQVARCW